MDVTLSLRPDLVLLSLPISLPITHSRLSTYPFHCALLPPAPPPQKCPPPPLIPPHPSRYQSRKKITLVQACEHSTNMFDRSTQPPSPSGSDSNDSPVRRTVPPSRSLLSFPSVVVSPPYGNGFLRRTALGIELCSCEYTTPIQYRLLACWGDCAFIRSFASINE